MAVSYNPKISTNGLVLCLDAANPKSYPGSGNTWFDLSGNRNHATLFNSPTFSRNGANQLAFTFNGTNQYASMPSTSSLTTSTVTIIGCISQGSSGTLLTKGKQGTYYNYGIVRINETINGFYARHNNADVYSGQLVEVFGLDICLEFIAVTYNGSATKFYKTFFGSTELISSTSSLNYSPSATNSENLTIGSFTSSGGSQTGYFAGEIFNICVYNRAFTDLEMQQHLFVYKSRIENGCVPLANEF